MVGEEPGARPSRWWEDCTGMASPHSSEEASGEFPRESGRSRILTESCQPTDTKALREGEGMVDGIGQQGLEPL